MFREGDYLITYNQWTGWQSDFLKGELEAIHPKDLKVGDKFWQEEDPIHCNGKVYGYCCNKVISVDEEKDWVKYKYGGSSRSFMEDRIFRLKDSQKIEEFCEKNPNSMNAGSWRV